MYGAVLAAGVKDYELPSLSSAIDQFDRYLAAPSARKVQAPEHSVVLEALGLRRAG